MSADQFARRPLDSLGVRQQLEQPGVAQPLRRIAEQLPHVELFSDDPGHFLSAEREAVVEQEVVAVVASSSTAN